MHRSKIFFVYVMIYVLIAGFVPSGSSFEVKAKRAEHSNAIGTRAKRHVWFPYNSAIALAVVVAIPLILKNRSVYMSYNFETNYYLPYFDTGQGIVPIPFATIDEPGVNAGTVLAHDDPALNGDQRDLDESGPNNQISGTNQTETICNSSTIVPETNTKSAPVKIKSTKKADRPAVTFTNSNSNIKRDEATKQPKANGKKSRINREILNTFLSRKKFYKVLENKMEKAGLNGEECLLKAICETAEQPLGEHNGVLGDIVHIIFTPTASRDEKLPFRYYDAVRHGQSGLCNYYQKLCPLGIFDFITL